MDVIFNRRSVRRYQERIIESEKIEQLLKAAMQAPSAGNQQPWEFLVIQNTETLNKLSQMSPFAKLVAHSPLVIILLANEDRLKFPEYWEQDLGAAAENILIEAVTLELGAVWLGVAPLEERMHFISELLELEEGLKPFCVISVGYPIEGHGNVFVDRYDPTRIHYEKY